MVRVRWSGDKDSKIKRGYGVKHISAGFVLYSSTRKQFRYLYSKDIYKTFDKLRENDNSLSMVRAFRNGSKEKYEFAKNVVKGQFWFNADKETAVKYRFKMPYGIRLD